MEHTGMLHHSQNGTEVRDRFCVGYIFMWRILSALCSYNYGKQSLFCIPSILGLCERKRMDTHIEWTVYFCGLCLIFHKLRQFRCLNVNVISHFLTSHFFQERPALLSRVRSRIVRAFFTVSHPYYTKDM